MEVRAMDDQKAAAAKVDEFISVQNSGWTFHGVENLFDEHVLKSVPGYKTAHDLVGSLSEFFVCSDSLIVDIGCSTGTLIRKLADRHRARPDVRLIGIDPVVGMIEKARSDSTNERRIQFVLGDIITEDLPSCDLITSLYTIQFIRPKHRQSVFDKIYASLNWGGAFILFEKVRAPDARFQDLMTQIYMDFKLDNGFAESEIIHKTRSLKSVLEPFSSQANIDLMKRAGFLDIMTIFKWGPFEGFLAIK
jgi:tRNA (cmo5U34)-methyltransferase